MQPIADAAIDLAAGARYTATGKRKTAVARVTLKPGTGAYIINGKTLNEFFPRATLQRTIRQPLETVGYEDRMDVVASMHGGGVSAQAGALRHGVSKALLEADPNLRTELKRRGFKFAGSTIMYAHLQACGLVNDHLVSCPRWREVQKATRSP